MYIFFVVLLFVVGLGLLTRYYTPTGKISGNQLIIKVGTKKTHLHIPAISDIERVDMIRVGSYAVLKIHNQTHYVFVGHQFDSFVQEIMSVRSNYRVDEKIGA